MTRNDIKSRLAEIVDNSYDHQTAHLMEDDLMTDFLNALAQHKVEPGDIADLAQLVLTTATIVFPRHYS